MPRYCPTCGAPCAHSQATFCPLCAVDNDPDQRYPERNVDRYPHLCAARRNHLMVTCAPAGAEIVSFSWRQHGPRRPTAGDARFDYRVGSIIEYQPFAGPLRQVEVIAREVDIKHGRPGFDAIYHAAGPGDDDPVWDSDPGDAVWGYDYQITRVLAY